MNTDFQHTPPGSLSVRWWRVVPLVGGLVVTLLWIGSLPIWWRTPPSAAPLDPSALPVTVSAPSWRDLLVVQLAIRERAIQQQRGFVQWQRGAQMGRLPLTVVTDGRLQRVLLPVGISPAWQGEIGSLQLTFSKIQELEITLVQAELIQRSPFAVDAWLGWWAAHWTPTPPGFWPLVQVTSVVLSLLLSLLLPPPWFTRSQRRGLFVCLLTLVCAASVLSTLNQHVRLLPALWQHYAGRSAAELARLAPHYGESAQVNDLLAAAAEALPDGPVLVLSNAPENSYLSVRAFYLLYPRRVTIAPMLTRGELRRHTGAILPVIGVAPAPGWQRVAGPLAGLEVWRAPGLPLPAPLPSATLGDLPWLVVALLVVLATGYGMAYALGWRRLLAPAAALPLGAGLLAWWMTLLSIWEATWSCWSIGLPFLLLGLLLPWRHNATGRKESQTTFQRLVNSPEKTTAITPIPPITKRANLRNPCLQLIRTNIWQRDWLAAWLVGGVVGGLFVSLLLGAGITPLSDQDSWTTWGYNSRALFVAGSITRFLAEQGQNELNHPSYPPGQPLLTTWAYVALGGIDERLGKLLMPFWYLALMGLVWTELRRRIRPWPAAGLTLLLATTPFLLDHAMLGNADLPFTVTMTLAALGLLRWVEQGAWRWLLAGGLALGMAAWIKLDGFYLGVALLTIGGLVRSVHLRQVRLAGWWTTWMGVLVALLLLVGLQVAWQHLTQRAGIVSETPSSAMLMVNGWENGRRGLTVIASELLFSHNNSTWSLLGAGFHLLWVVCLGAVGLAGLRRWRAPGLLLFGLGVAAIVAFYGLIYVLRPYFSMERYLFHAAPLAILAAGYAFKDG